MKKVLTVGGVTHDIFIDYPQPEMLHVCLQEGTHSFLALEKGKKIEVKGLEYHVGGGAANTAISFARCGFAVSIISKRGNDAAGQKVVEALQAASVDTSFIGISQNMPTATSFIIPTEGGDRIVLAYRGANLTLNEQDISERAMQGVQLLYGTSLSGDAAKLLVPLVKMAKKHNLLVTINPGLCQLQESIEYTKQALKHIDVLILNAHEAEQCMISLMRTDRSLLERMLALVEKESSAQMPELLRSKPFWGGTCFNMTTFLKEILQRGPRIVALTHGKEGVYVATQDKLLFHPSIETPIASTIGAGDAFGSAFAAWLLKGASVEDALRAGIINSTAVICHVGAQTGLCTMPDIENKIKELDKKLLKTFSL